MIHPIQYSTQDTSVIKHAKFHVSLCTYPIDTTTYVEIRCNCQTCIISTSIFAVSLCLKSLCLCMRRLEKYIEIVTWQSTHNKRHTLQGGARNAAEREYAPGMVQWQRPSTDNEHERRCALPLGRPDVLHTTGQKHWVNAPLSSVRTEDYTRPLAWLYPARCLHNARVPASRPVLRYPLVRHLIS